MPTFDEIINSTDADVLIPTPIAQEIIQEVPQYSALMQLCRRQNMGTKTLRMPIINALPIATFGNGASAQNKGGVYKDLIDVIFKNRSQGYKCSGFAANDMFEQQLLGATDTQGKPLVDWSQDATRALGRSLAYSGSGVWADGASLPE